LLTSLNLEIKENGGLYKHLIKIGLLKPAAEEICPIGDYKAVNAQTRKEFADKIKELLETPVIREDEEGNEVEEHYSLYGAVQVVNPQLAEECYNILQSIDKWLPVEDGELSYGKTSEEQILNDFAKVRFQGYWELAEREFFRRYPKNNSFLSYCSWMQKSMGWINHLPLSCFVYNYRKVKVNGEEREEEVYSLSKKARILRALVIKLWGKRIAGYTSVDDFRFGWEKRVLHKTAIGGYFFKFLKNKKKWTRLVSPKTL
jgi:hypothetical protein